ncbi:MAG: LEA type 2 family protein [Anaeromyxobacter sp.]|nr:LEA type 2 family protein [Anaeromyxobacter sp.]MBL0278239.1 LEA type 2 family protein [Anaeromyxobacter sp.]
MRTRPHLAWLVTLASLLSGCAGLSELAKGAFQRPTLTFVAVTVEALDFDGATLAFDHRLDNPNGFGLSLSRVGYWLQLDGRVVTRGEVKGGLTIRAKGSAPVRFTARLPFAEVPRLLELVQRGGAVAYTLGGEVAVATPVGPVTLPVQHSGSVALPGLPTFRVAGVGVRLASLTEVELTVRVAVANPNPFPLPDGALRFGLAVGGEVVLSSEEGLSAVPARGQGELRIPVTLSLVGAGRTAAAAARGGGAEVRLTGEAKLGALPIPIDIGGRAGGR